MEVYVTIFSSKEIWYYLLLSNNLTLYMPNCTRGKYIFAQDWSHWGSWNSPDKNILIVHCQHQNYWWYSIPCQQHISGCGINYFFFFFHRTFGCRSRKGQILICLVWYRWFSAKEPDSIFINHHYSDHKRDILTHWSYVFLALTHGNNYSEI